jgi:hypothetical protein
VENAYTFVGLVAIDLYPTLFRQHTEPA